MICCCNCLLILLFRWMLNIFIKGKKKDLDVNDLYKSLDEHTSSILGDELEK